mgnify:CR=1 FL=1
MYDRHDPMFERETFDRGTQVPRTRFLRDALDGLIDISIFILILFFIWFVLPFMDEKVPEEEK